MCLKCGLIMFHPGECKQCEYIVCSKCQQSSSYSEGGSYHTTPPGKVHKMYKEMLKHLEFKCPNQAHGCQEVLKYEELEDHLSKACEARMQLCPNRCSKTKKFGVAELQQHIE